MDEELGGEQWELIALLLPPRQGGGRPRADDWRTLESILWVLRSGARWEDLPPKYVSRSTYHLFDYRLLHGYPGKDSQVENFRTGS